MAYEPMRGDGNEIQRKPIPLATWTSVSPGMGKHQYSSVPSPYEYQSHPHGTSTPYSGVSDFQYFDPSAPYSSQTAILQNNNPASNGNNNNYNPQHNRRSSRITPAFRALIGAPWQPGFWAQFPWRGMLALLITIAATFACVIVLVKSQDVPIEEWTGKFQPTVYISICTATANIALTYALYEGVVISFWRKAGQGATLRELHQYWQSGSSLWGAFQGVAQLRGKVTAIACIMTVLSIARGPLMQRASSVKSDMVSLNGTLNIVSAVQLPIGYAGRDSGRTSTPSMMNPNFTDVVQAYTNRDNIAGTFSGCANRATCFTSVKGFGFGVSCNTSAIPYDLEPELNSNNSVTRLPTVRVFSADAWQIPIYNTAIKTAENYPTNAALLLNATFMGEANQNWNGSLVSHMCALRAGIVSYPITISNNTITLTSPSWTNDTYLEDVGFAPLPYNALSNIAGFILAAKAFYEGTADYQFGGGVGWILSLKGASANRYLRRTDPFSNYYALSNNISWRDPMDDMINSMREIAFRTSLQIAAHNTSYPNASQTVPYTAEKPETVYTANYSYMVGAVVLSLLGAIAVLPTYRGFWELGRTVSLSPLEVAKAFNAPLLSQAEGNRTADEMLRELGFTKVRYGEAGVVLGGDHGMNPMGGGGGAYTGGHVDGNVVRRIGMGPVTEVRPPEKGARYV